MKNEDRENIKMLFNDILNIITDDYNIIFDNEEKNYQLLMHMNGIMNSYVLIRLVM